MMTHPDAEHSSDRTAVESPQKVLRWIPAPILRLDPAKRFLLAAFLFLDVCILSFGCLLLSGRIVLPF